MNILHRKSWSRDRIIFTCIFVVKVSLLIFFAVRFPFISYLIIVVLGIALYEKLFAAFIEGVKFFKDLRGGLFKNK